MKWMWVIFICQRVVYEMDVGHFYLPKSGYEMDVGHFHLPESGYEMDVGYFNLPESGYEELLPCDNE